MMKRNAFSLLLAAGAVFFMAKPNQGRAEAVGPDAGWTQFRGPDSNGHTAAKGLPLHWSDTENVAWKTPIPHKGWSTPLILGDQIWVTSATEEGREFWAYCLNRSTGKVLHEVKLFTSESPEPLGNGLNSYASCTGVLETGRVYLHFGSYGTACLDTTTFKEVWRRTDLPCRHYRGPGSSVFPWKETIVLTMDGVDVQYLAALDKKTGATVWKTDRNTEFNDLDPSGNITADGDFRKSYSTPILIEPGGGKPQLVSTGSRATVGYDPDTGKELWRTTYKGFSNASLPAWIDGLLVVNTGHGKATLRAYRITPETKGDITNALVWEQTKYIPTRSSPVVAGGLIHLIADNGFLSAVDPKTGELLFSERTSGSCSASPMFADGRLYFCNERGDCYVTEPAREYKQLALNTLPSGIMSGPAAAGNQLYLRTKTHLYRIQQQP